MDPRDIIFERVKKFNIDKRIIKILRRPERVIEVSIPVKSQNSDIKIYTGYRVIYNTALGPGKGGIRFHPNVTKEEVELLAFWMTIKNSLLNLPFGGAKGGVRVNPKELSNFELEQLAREYIRKVYEFVGVDKDIPAPDVYTDEKIMAIMLDEYENIARKREPGMITGKPIELGGDRIRNFSTSLGGFYVFEKIKDLTKSNVKTIAIHGFGNVGLNFARIAYENGYKIIAVADSKGGIYNPEGLNIPELIEIKKKTGSVINYKDGKVISNDEVLELEVDLLIPASIENVINKNNVEKINAKIILELANGPIDINIENKLLNKGIIIIPDVLANAGGVVASYFEWVQNRIGFFWSEEESKEKLKQKMVNITEKVYNVANELNIDLRTAAYYIAIRRLEEAIKYRFFLYS